MDTLQMVVTVLTAVLASSGCWSVILYIVQKRDKKKDTNTAEKKMLLALAHDRLYYLLGDILTEQQDGKRKGVTREEFENIKILYDGYKGLGGNGTCERLYKEVEKLPTVFSHEHDHEEH
ncbi:MAG: hypothetical protein LIP12_01625 [Clostridiales bacterium]|nr:hypothetical protein [Clostridiales bacterium]